MNNLEASLPNNNETNLKSDIIQKNVDTITVGSVCKSYKGRQVVNNVSLDIKKGEIVGLLGPNGAGKTTTFYMVVGLVKPDSGKVFIMTKIVPKRQCTNGLELVSVICLKRQVFFASLL